LPDDTTKRFIRAMFARYRRETSLAIAYAALLLLLLAAAPSFYRGDQFRAILVTSAPILIAAIGMTLVILARQVDISIGAQFSLCGIIAGLLVKTGLPMPLAALGTLAFGGLLGAINGALVAGLGLPSIVVTLATMVILRETLRWWREGEFVRNLPPDFQWFGLGQDAGQWLVVALALAVFGLFAWSLRNIQAGRAIYATGSDPEAAFLAGIQPRKVTFGVFVVLGALTGLAAVLNSVRFAVVDPTAGTGLEMTVIAAVVVGGVAISGGRGTLLGPLLGVLLLTTIRPALVFLGAEAHWEKAIQGAIILAAVAADAFQPKRRTHG
jgi:rhamnose transport system permease protein